MMMVILANKWRFLIWRVIRLGGWPGFMGKLTLLSELRLGDFWSSSRVGQIGLGSFLVTIMRLVLIWIRREDSRSPCGERGIWYTLIYCELLEIHYRGYRYTWTNNRDNENHIELRLDRATATTAWHSLFPTQWSHIFILGILITSRSCCVWRSPLLVDLGITGGGSDLKPCGSNRLIVSKWLATIGETTVI